ncbi:hypothetical protein BDR04DRAFT_1131128 [Suillus decipiens]|nr:hypothetical protein BDR04DRAFT_1131128 [Suillus decipiens]
MDLFTKPSYFGETFYYRKSKYSLGCQAVILPHNLLIVDYFLGHPGSVHDAFAFRSTHLYEEHADLLPDGHWIWADKLRFRIRDEKNLEFAVQWIKCCIILHNMIIRFEIECRKKDWTYKSSLKWTCKEG